MAGNVSKRVTLGATMMAPNPSTTVTTPVPLAATTTMTATMVAAPAAAPTATCAMFCAVEFDKGGQHSSGNCAKFQNHDQWSKWNCALIRSAQEHKCEQVLDPSYAPNPSDPDKISLFESQQMAIHADHKTAPSRVQKQTDACE